MFCGPDESCPISLTSRAIKVTFMPRPGFLLNISKHQLFRTLVTDPFEILLMPVALLVAGFLEDPRGLFLQQDQVLFILPHTSALPRYIPAL